MKYAVNAQLPVVLVGSSYYALDNGVWFVAGSPTGPWQVAAEVPEEIYTIPPGSPVYYATFVRVYQASEDEVEVGYTGGYQGAYEDGGTVVYGTGWTYEPWTGNEYYGWGWTWGYSYVYVPWYQWWVWRPWWNPPGGLRAAVIDNIHDRWQGRNGGTSLGPAEARTGVRIHDPGALLRLLVDPELQAGDLYSAGRVEIEGDLVEFVTEAYATRPTGAVRGAWLARLIDGARRYDLRSAPANAEHHYDLGNDFYRLWLDERMQYTCAFFPTPEASLEHAQLAKLERVCRKLALRPGERVNEAGCGWGGLALYMAERHGVQVRAFNISEEQIAYAREQARQRGLSRRVEFVLDDYRNAGHDFSSHAPAGAT